MASDESIKQGFQIKEGIKMPQMSSDLMQIQLEMMKKQTEFNMTVMTGTQDIVVRTQGSLKKLPEDFERGLNEVKNMFWIQFGLGIALLFLSIIFYISGFDVLTYIFGASGGITLVTTFIATPPLRLQKNRVDLSQWMMAYFNWFNTSLATNTMVQQMFQSRTLTWDKFKEIHSFLLETTDRTLKIIDERCEFQYAGSEVSKEKDDKKKS